MYAVLHVPEFSLQAVLRTESHAPAAPAALFTERTKKSLLLCANPAARAAGVTPGMTAPQAVARCPTLLIRTANRGAEADATAALLAIATILAPHLEDTAPGICTVDLRGAPAGHPERAAAAAVAQLAALGLHATAGLGTTPLLALYAARAAGQTAGSGRKAGSEDPALPRAQARAPGAATAPPMDVGRGLPTPTPPAAAPTAPSSPAQAELALGAAGAPSASAAHAPAEAVAEAAEAYTTGTPAAVLSITDGAAFLAPLPIATIDPPPEQASILASWGVRTLGQLVALPRDDIGRRLGTAGLELWDRAQGGRPRPLRPVEPPQTFRAALEFEEPVETLEPLLFLLRRFLERLTVELRAAGFVAAALELGLSLETDARHERTFRLPEPTADIDVLFRTLHTHLDSVRTDAAIVAVQLRVEPTRPLVRQQGLFDTALRDPHGFAETLARVGAIVGADRVGTPQRLDTHRPDAVTLVAPSPVIPPAAPAPLHPPLGLPLRRFRPPLPARLELTDGRPTYLQTDRFAGAVSELRGPWLASGDWWQADGAWRRTEYDIALTGGGVYRLVYADQQWFVEGEYD